MYCTVFESMESLFLASSRELKQHCVFCCALYMISCKHLRQSNVINFVLTYSLISGTTIVGTIRGPILMNSTWLMLIYFH